VHTLIHAAGIRPKKISSYSDRDIEKINVDLTKKMVSLCKILKSKIVYISSDSVYENSNERNENSASLAPTTKYARSKFESELIIQESGIDHTIVRTSFFGGLHIDKDNYLNKAHNNILKGKLITASSNHYTSSIGLKSLNYFLKGLENIGFTGIVNIGCTNVTSQYDKVKLIWKKFEKEVNGKNLNLVDDLFQLDLQMDMGKLLSIFKIVDISFVKEVESEFMKTKDS
jgi:dTDP-4-dehydrorhamnose reductase